MRYLSRSKVYKKVSVEKDAKKVYIFCEGNKTEIGYFKFFQGFSSNVDIIPIPNDNGKSDPVKLKESAELIFFGTEEVSPKFILNQDYHDEVWFVIDTDNWNEAGKIDQLKQFCSEQNMDFLSWHIAQSNPSFEIWLYYHFFSAKPIEDDIILCETFKQFVHLKIDGGFDNRKMPIELGKAIDNSEKNFDLLEGQPTVFSTEMHNLGKIVLSFVGEQFEKILLSSED